MQNINYSSSNNFNISLSPPPSPRSNITPPVSPRKITTGANSINNQDLQVALHNISYYNSQSFLTPHSPSKWSQSIYTRGPQTTLVSPGKNLQSNSEVGLKENSPKAPSLNPSQKSPEKQINSKKRLFQDENLPPESISQSTKKYRSSRDSILELLDISASFSTKKWSECYAKVGPQNLSVEKFLEAINEEKDAGKRADYLQSLMAFQTRMLCMLWTTLPELELHSDDTIYEGYYPAPIANYTEHALHVFFSNENKQWHFKDLMQECFKSVGENCYPKDRENHIIEDWKKGKAVSLNIGWIDHITAMVVHKNIVAYGNKGECHSSFGSDAIKFFRMTKPDNFNENFIKKISLYHLSEPSKRQINFLEGGKMAKILGLIPLFSVPKTTQKDSYCSTVACNLNIHSLIIFSLLNNREENLTDEFVESTKQNAIADYKKVKQFIRSYALNQFSKLLFHPEAQYHIDKKDLFKIIGNLQGKICKPGKLAAYIPGQQILISSFFQRVFHTIPLEIDDCTLDFTESYKKIPGLAKNLIDTSLPGTFFLRPGPNEQTVMVNYVDQNGQAKTLSIKKIKGEYILKKPKENRTIRHFQDLFDNTLKTPFLNCGKLRSLCLDLTNG